MLSEDRQSHLAHVVIDGIWKDDLVDFVDEDKAIRIAKKSVVRFAQELEDIDIKARQMVGSLKRDVQEGSQEWDVMYQKYFEDELKRRGGGNF